MSQNGSNFSNIQVIFFSIRSSLLLSKDRIKYLFFWKKSSLWKMPKNRSKGLKELESAQGKCSALQVF